VIDDVTNSCWQLLNHCVLSVAQSLRTPSLRNSSLSLTLIIKPS